MASPLERWLLLMGLVERRGSPPCESDCARQGNHGVTVS